LKPGDLLLVFSDGFSEAMNPEGEFLGDQRILSVVLEHRGKTVPAIITALLRSAAAHSGAAPQSDDRTVLAIRRYNESR
jgi:serine phosphatase RsbU (regulator of sigma subunit)